MTPQSPADVDVSSTTEAGPPNLTGSALFQARAAYLGKLIRACELARPVESIRMVRAFRMVAKEKATGVDVPRLKTLWRLSRRIDEERVPGDIVECGVWNGGTAAVMALASKRLDRHYWLYDSFAGFPKPGEKDVPDTADIREGEWKGSQPKVRRLFARLGIPEARTHITAGWFQDTLPRSPVKRIALLHLDADLYESVKLSLECFYDRVTPGGFIVLDDYGFWPGCRTAVDEFLSQRGVKVNLRVSDTTGRWFRKPLDG